MPRRLTVEDFAWTAFDRGEHTCFDDSAYGVTIYPIEHGIATPTAYFSINPIKEASHRLDSNVAAYRNFLVELDEGHGEAKELRAQMDYVKSLHVPYSTLVFSGGKSLHFLICLDKSLPDKRAYEVMARRIHAVVQKADHKTKNPSRLARWPGHFREDKQRWQHLLEVKPRVTEQRLDGWLSYYGVTSDPAPPRVDTPKIWEGMKLPPRVKTLRFIDQGVSMGERNNALYVAAHDLRESGYSLEEALDLLEDVPLGPDFGERERQRTIQSAYSKSS